MFDPFLPHPIVKKKNVTQKIQVCENLRSLNGWNTETFFAAYRPDQQIILQSREYLEESLNPRHPLAWRGSKHEGRDALEESSSQVPEDGKWMGRWGETLLGLCMDTVAQGTV